MRNILFLLVILLMADQGWAQRRKDTVNYDCKSGQYVDFDMGGGIQTLLYDISDFGERKIGMGINARAGYQRYFNDNWGAGAGLRLYTISSKSTIDYLEKIGDAVDEAGKPYEHRTYFYSLMEKQKNVQLSLPIGAYYQMDLAHRIKLVASLGAQVDMSLSSRFSISDGELETRAWYEAPRLELFGMTYHNEYFRSGFSGNYSLKTAVSLYADASVMYALTRRIDVGAHLVGNLGITPVSKSNDNYIYDPDCHDANAYRNPVYNGVLNSHAVEKSRTASVGITVGIRYRLEPKAKPFKPVVPVTDTIPAIVVDTVPHVVVDTVPNVVIDSVPDIRIDTIPQIVVDSTPSFNDDDIELIEIPDTTDLDQQYQLGLIYFDFNKSIDPAMDMDLNKFAKFMRTNTKFTLDVVGHTDNVGSRAQNEALGMRRAEFIKQEFIKRGVDGKRINCISKWFSEPLVPNTSEENRAKNRRVELIIRWE